VSIFTIRATAAYSAGLFEGEGWIGMERSYRTTRSKKGRQAKVSLSMSDEDVVRRFHQAVGCGRVNGPYVKGTNKPMWVWAASGHENVQALVACWWPWLGMRRRAKAREVLMEAAIQPLRPGKQLRCPKGHPYDERNTYRVIRRNANGGAYINRLCRECARRRARMGSRGGGDGVIIYDPRQLKLT
jgi:hypothetical protein